MYVYKVNVILNPCNLGAAATVHIFVEERVRGFLFSLDYLIYPRMDFSVGFKSIFNFFWVYVYLWYSDPAFHHQYLFLIGKKQW